MILLIDNYDSFVYNLARYVGRLGRERMVVRNDAMTLDEIEAMAPEAIILSPGPCSPTEAGICNDVLRRFAPTIPIFGVCLGHQCMGAVFGGRVVRAAVPVHGKTGIVSHNGEGLFMGLPDPLKVARYHSLVVELPSETPLQVTAQTDDGIIMALSHTHYPTYGVQFHPESVLTEYGLDIMRNFIGLADIWHEQMRGAA
ncbi:MAG: aminodeoxychorismate/anthranilate synthase component II [Alphaproteobacteria bacterium]|nr:aminodeoxychorismate/anthranilate synthase component II [Alphaproteobacteria bacterium]